MAFAQKQNTTAPYRSTAKVVDGNLVLSLPDAITPIVWRMELNSVKASALEVREKDGRHVLFLKTPRADTHEIAPYISRDLAVDALMQVSAALSAGDAARPPSVVEAQPSSAKVYSPSKETRHSSAIKWLIALIGVIIVIGLFAYLGSMSAPMMADTVPGESTATTITGDPNTESGVPQSADQMLRGF